jgi:non-homologous end joining protein Ku
MEPNKGGDHVFVLLRDALISTDKIGIARVVISSHANGASVVIRG